MIKQYRLGGLIINLLSYSSRDQKSEIKVSVGLAPSENENVWFLKFIYLNVSSISNQQI